MAAAAVVIVVAIAVVVILSYVGISAAVVSICLLVSSLLSFFVSLSLSL
jgi:hypothetical protein